MAALFSGDRFISIPLIPSHLPPYAFACRLLIRNELWTMQVNGMSFWYFPNSCLEIHMRACVETRARMAARASASTRANEHTYALACTSARAHTRTNKPRTHTHTQTRHTHTHTRRRHAKAAPRLPSCTNRQSRNRSSGKCARGGAHTHTHTHTRTHTNSTHTHTHTHTHAYTHVRPYSTSRCRTPCTQRWARIRALMYHQLRIDCKKRAGQTLYRLDIKMPIEIKNADWA